MTRAMTPLKKINQFTTGSMKTVIILATVLCTAFMTLQVIARYIFQISISGLDELAGHTAVWLYLIGAAYGSYGRSQIKADVLHLVIKNQQTLDCIRVLTTAVSVVVCGFLTVWSYNYAQWSIVKHESTPTLQIPTILFQLAFVVGAALMVIYHLAEMIAQIRLCRQGHAASGKEKK